MQSSLTKKALVLLWALLWALVTNHCRLETLPGMEFLSCAVEEAAAPHESSDCETDGCATVETLAYKNEETPLEFGAPTQVFLLAQASADPAASSEDVDARRPPEGRLAALAAGWQFLLRAASTPRAPTFPPA